MKNWIIRWIASCVALAIVVTAVPHLSLDKAHPLYLFGALVALGFANAFIRPVIMFFAWPINCITFGLLGFVLNVLFFWIIGNLGLGFHVDSGSNGLQGAFLGSVTMGVLSGLINFWLKDRGDRDDKGVRR